LAAIRYALTAGLDPEAILRTAIENIGNGTASGGGVRRLADELTTFDVPAGLLLKLCSKFSESEQPDIRRFVALALPACVQPSAQALEILRRLGSDTNSVVGAGRDQRAVALAVSMKGAVRFL
jgi:hypothetical protein